MKKLDELLGSEAGRKMLMETIPRLFLHDKNYAEASNEEASNEHAPLDRIAWCAAHRLNGLPENVVDNLKNPVELNRVVINGEVLYLAQGGNHRIERFVEAGRKSIPATVCDWDLEPASLKKGIATEYRLDRPSDKGKISVPNRDLTPAEADLLKALGLVKDETAPPPPRKRRIFGFGIGD